MTNWRQNDTPAHHKAEALEAKRKYDEQQLKNQTK